MISMILFAIIGVHINAGVGYWICYAAYCVASVCKAISETIKEKL